MDRKEFEAFAELEGYEQITLIGEGGYSRVYAALDPLMSRKVAVKVLKTSAIDDVVSRRFLLEARSLAGLKHPNIVEVYKLALSPSGFPFMVMELLEGITLRDYLNEKGHLQDLEFVLIFRSLLSALDCAHRQNIVHRDIKPENVFLCNFDMSGKEHDAGFESEACVRLLDFGIARILSTEETQSMTRTGSLIGSPRYMSPEQCRNATVDNRSDLYSIACLMYECLEGKALFDGASAAEIMYKHLHESPQAVISTSSIISKTLQQILTKALAASPGERFENAAEFLQAVSGLTEITTGRSRAKVSRLHPAFIVVAGLLLFSAFAFGLLQLFKSEQRKTSSQFKVPDRRNKKAEFLLNKYNQHFKSKQDRNARIRQLQHILQVALEEKDYDSQVHCYFNIGKQCHEQDNCEAALSRYRMADRASRQLHPAHELRARAKQGVIGELIDLGKLDEADKLAREVLKAGYDRAINMNEYYIADSGNLLAKILYLKGKNDEADSVLQVQWQRYLNLPKDLTANDLERLYQAVELQSKWGDKDLLRKNMSEFARFLETKTEAKSEGFDGVCSRTVELCHKLGMNSEAGEIEKAVEKSKARKKRTATSISKGKPGGEFNELIPQDALEIDN